MDICVIGLGEVGSESFKEICKVTKAVGVEINKERADALRAKGHDVRDNAPASDVYIIAVYTTDQVMSVLNALDLSKKPLVVIESTISPHRYNEMHAWAKKHNTDLVSFPHRFVPYDPKRWVFNTDRVIGGTTPAATQRAITFFSQFMDKKLMHATTFDVASLSKVAENAHRFVQIELAQEFRRSCDEHGIDFNALRAAMNTKWNVSLLEPRDGIKLRCLPKDMRILADYFSENPVFDLLHKRNEAYRDYAKKMGFPSTPD
jgi:UDP-N-acetyl-D-mannosaminuronate dehydrogenase